MLAKQYGVSAVCRALGVSRSGHYARRSRKPSARQKDDIALGDEIENIHARARGVYGYPRIRLHLSRQGRGHSKRRVARLMAQRGLKGRRRGKYKPQCTHSNHEYGYSRNLLKQELGGSSNNVHQAWVSDTTYIKTDQGWAYLAVTMDLYSRYIVGWSMSAANDSALTIEAVEKAAKAFNPPKDFIHHSDRGSAYASDGFRKAIGQVKARSSMSAKGNCYDNAAMESFFGTLKAECTLNLAYRDFNQAEQSIFSYIEGFYNSSRLHTSIRCTPKERISNAIAKDMAA
ncbi:MAG: IS3 family transposase [Opitutaceae bacterium]|nr:IS3 family transposase [Opitutaceae bacterium]